MNYQDQANHLHTQHMEKDDCVAFTTERMYTEESSKETRIKWYIDSGATDHMVNNLEYLTDVRDLEVQIRVYVAKSNVFLISTHVGNITVSVRVNGQCRSIEINDVLFVKDLRHNFLSVQRLANLGLDIVFTSKGAQIKRENRTIVFGKKIDNMYELEFNLEKEVQSNICKSRNSLEIWHKRLGHLSYKNVLKLCRGMVDGINVKNNDTCNTLDICKTCNESNITRLPFNTKSKFKSKRFLELVHSDVCGPITPCTYDNRRYILTFIDDYTHFAMVYLIESKSEVFECFKNYEATMHAKVNKKISSLCCDNGREYLSKSLRQFCWNKGIIIKNTVPYTPQLNGVAERFNRTLLQKSRAMILESKLSKEMWGEAVLCATYLINRSPTVSIEGNVTPAEMFYNRKPNLNNLKIFGCLGYRKIPKEKLQGKFEPRGECTIMIGYTHNGYRLWNPLERKVIISRDVVFDESKNLENLNVQATRLEILEMGNKEIEKEGIDESEEEIAELLDIQRSDRIKKLPLRFEDYDMTHLAMCAESFINDVPTNLEKAKTRADYVHWKNAIDNEISALERNHTWTLVKRPENAYIIDSKWIFKLKRDHNNQVDKYKARLVARGFKQRNGLDFEETYAPVARLTTIRSLLAVINYKNLRTQQMDVKSAFLHGILEEVIYMEKPEGVPGNNDNVCKLHKALYGLKQAPYCWNKRFNEFMEKQKFIRSQNDSCLYVKSSRDNIVYLLLYVDDIIIASNNEDEINQIKVKLKESFEMEDLGELKQFLGITVRRTSSGIYLNQKNYLSNLLERFGMKDCNKSSTPITENILTEEQINKEELSSQKPIRELIGCLMYVMQGTRPDLSVSVNTCSRFQKYTTSDLLWKTLKGILRYVKGTLDYELFFDKHCEEALVGFADSDWAGDKSDRKSTSGYLFKIYGGTVCWTTRKQSLVTVSSTEAEYVALSEAAREGKWLLNLLKDLKCEISDFVIFEDNQSTTNLTRKWDHRRLKHIDVKYNFIRELVSNKIVIVKYLCTTDQVADILTKILVGTRFKQHCINLGIKNV